MLLLALLSCTGDPDLDQPRSDDFGYRPVYGSSESAQIAWTSPRSIVSPGKIYVYGKYLLVNEAREGIHVFDNSNPQFPIALGFLRIIGNSDMAIKDNILYADYLGNLVALTIDDFTNIQQKGKLELANWEKGVPPPVGYRFECADPAMGIVVAWKKVKNENLKCYAIR